MNCRPGDIALWVTRSVLVEVMRRSVAGEIYRAECGGMIQLTPHDMPAWNVRILGLPQPSASHPERRFKEMSVYDASLRPIRDGEGEDETFSWVPRRITETA